MRLVKAGIAYLMLATGVVSANDLDSAINKDYAYLDALYQHLHSNPEISFQEEQTAARIATELRQVGYAVTENVGGYGVVAVLQNGEGPTVLVRADMDGLPVKEQTGLTFASTATATNDKGTVVPAMHACGHDVHMTSLVGTARRLAAMQDQWQGTLVMIGQPAEERVGGAKAMLSAGLFDRFPRPDYNLALHVSSTLAAGDVGLTAGYAFANVDSVDIAVKGIGGHGAYPHTTKDPVLLASQIVVALQALVSRETSPLDSAVVTVGSFHAGTKHNIISDNAHLQLTVRSYSDDVRQNLLKGIKRVAEAQAVSLGLPEELWPDVTYSEGTPATYNNPALTERIHGVFTKTFGAEHVFSPGPVMGAEDFSYFGLVDPKIPSLMFRLGAAVPADVAAAARGEKRLASLHSPFFAPDREDTLKHGVAAMTTAVLDLLAKPKN